jgi:polysaccharide biosynthesis transport protein
MNIIKFLKIIAARWIYIIAIPVVVALVVFLLTMKIPPTYTTFSTLYSGVTSNTGLSVDAIKVDNVATQNEYNNILTMLKSVSLFEEVSLHLLAQHLIQEKPDKKIFSEDAFDELQKYVPDEVKKLVVKNNFESTLKNLRGFITEDENNYIYRLMNYGHRYYSIQAISNIKSERLSASDLIRLTYETDDPGICYNTVKFATEIFINRYSELKISQSNSAVAYFEKKLQETQGKLDVAEQKLLEFNVGNDIINYYEQTEQITTQQEKIELRLQDVRMQFEASVAVLGKLEKEIDQRYNINLRNTELLKVRQQLVQYNNAITSIELNGRDAGATTLAELKQKRMETEKQLAGIVDSLNIYENKSQGIESQRILSQWLDAVKDNESSSAQLKSMQQRLAEFMLQFKRYAPLGATIKRYEREIDVYEREYLSILHHLGLARQNEQNINMRSNMKVYDEPNFPINAIPAPRKLYMIAAALFALIFYILAIFIIELLDTRIKTPSNLRKLSEMDVLAAFAKYSDEKDIYTPLLNSAAAMLIYDFLRLKQNQAGKPFVLQIAGNWEGSGKRFVLASIVKLLKEQQHSYEVLNLDKQVQVAASEQDELGEMRDVSGRLSQITEYKSLIENRQCDFVLSLVAPVSNGLENPALLSSASLTLMVFDAGSSWSDADAFMLNKARRAISHEMQAVLTKANPDNLEEMYGEIPKKRTAFRKLIKKILSRVVH